MYQVEDCGIFVGYVTLPFTREKDFYEKEIKKGIFESYKKKLKKILSSYDLRKKCDKQFHNYLYEPKAYCLFGQFDLVVLSLVDSFTLSTQIFHPYSYLNQDEKTQSKSPNFEYQAITGILPKIKEKKKDITPDLFETVDKTFLQAIEEQKLPLIGICSLKVNNGLLIGSGGNLIYLVVKKLNHIIQQSQHSPNKLKYIIYHPFSWNEISIIFFSDSYELINKTILEIRELEFIDLKKELISDYDLTIYSDIVKECFVTHLIEQDPEKEKYDVEYSHVFSTTMTSFGYDLDLLSENNSDETNKKQKKTLKDILRKETNLNLYSKLFVKPGHLKSLIKELELVQTNKPFKIIIGNGDFIYINEQPKGVNNQYDDLIQKHLLHPDKTVKKDIRKFNTIPEIWQTSKDIPGKLVNEKHFEYTKHLESYAFNRTKIKEIHSYLKALNISKILREKVINLFVIFNNGIQDTILFAYFIDLRPFLKYLFEYIAVSYADSKENPLPIIEISDVLDELCKQFETAFSNRLHQSHIMNELHDYNLEFNGGIQQIITAFDGAYKAISSVLNDGNRNFVYTSGTSKVTSTLSSVKLNYNHLFQPEMFIAISTHEAANFYLDKGPHIKEIKEFQKSVKEISKYDHTISFEYLIVDLVTLYLGYNNNYEVFAYWHWNYFLQTSTIYNTDGVPNETIFERFMTRMLLLYQSVKLENPDLTYQLKMEAPVAKIQTLWLKHFPPINEMIKSYILNEEVQNALTALFKIIKSIVIDDFCGISERNLSQNSLDRKKEVLNTYLNKEMGFNKKITDSLIHELRINAINQIYNKVSSLMKDGKMFVPNEILEQSYSFYAQSIFYSYLKLIFDKNKGQDPKKYTNSVVIREKSTGKFISENQLREEQKPYLSYSAILFDNLGGSFSHQTKNRRDQLKYKAAFLINIWNLSFKNKINLFK